MDERFQEKKFLRARAIVSNNDVKYALNKQRSEAWALAHKEPILWCYARDRPNTEALATEPNLLEKKYSGYNITTVNAVISTECCS